MLLSVVFGQEDCSEGGPGSWAGMEVEGPGKDDFSGLWAGNQASGLENCRPPGLLFGSWFPQK